MNDPKHIMFIVAAYAVAFVVVAFMTLKLMVDHRSLKRAVLRVESRRAGRPGNNQRR